MPLISKDETYGYLKKNAYNSSHFVWLLAELKYFKTNNGWIFAFLKRGSVTLLALDPLASEPQEGFLDWNVKVIAAFREAWLEFCQEIQPQAVAFVAIQAPFMRVLTGIGFQIINFGQEPWIDLSSCIPTGNIAKGVRNARNQALRAGVVIEEIAGESLSFSLESSEQSSRTIAESRRAIQDLFKEWKGSRPLDLGGFLNATDPLAFCESRHYFLARDKNHKPCGLVIATPVASRAGCFLEDTYLASNAPRGTGELVTLEALVRLRNHGYKIASLGVVSTTQVDLGNASDLPLPIRGLVGFLPGVLQRLYNFNGLETFRKRFKPDRWEGSHLAVKDLNSSTGWVTTATWLAILWAIVLAFQPRIRLSLPWAKKIINRALTKHPLSLLMLVNSIVLFWVINKFGELPQWALDKFGFSADSPFSEWPLRSLVSDYLYFGSSHFLYCTISCFLILFWAERSHKLSFLVPCFLATSLLDDFINYVCIIVPFKSMHPSLLQPLVNNKDVGNSLILLVFLGIQLCQFRRNREILFAILGLGTVFGVLFVAMGFHQFVLNLNHFLFLSLGYIMGKIKFELHRSLNRKTSKGKPPPSITVAAPKKRMKAAA